ncbi:hypothetical protein P170DRAFT_195237 [Aspergillus steynii IBT 23096]|uniref:Zn(2)-C6 fungal-type domain-containing protein n=1 Tax=Aspergillus steynii IBT 23096 TaxID=1392250 RepID=A0A2I2G436_9EURO|nr:uncharacterized protein P170DRAFT_195237 [Aspergillus steynii IBT 23096]PLB47623.1 hypothetical protein P170DRAFT_195237 [Aspergillus steynii IBT 23096]
MARYPGLSKGCKTCRERKVKCDETWPQCSQCIRRTLKCPGPTQGSIFLEATSSDKSSKYKRIGENVTDQSNPNCPPNSAIVPAKRQRQVPRKTPPSCTTPAALQPNVSLTLQLHMVDRFLSFFEKSGMYKTRRSLWIYLCRGMGEPEGRSDWQSSVRAVSLAFFGTFNKDKAAMVEARKWYGVSIQHQRQKLLRAPRLASIQPDRPEEITNFVILAYAEMMLSTNPNACYQHLSAAATLLSSLHPRTYQSGHLRELFQVIQRLLITYNIDQFMDGSPARYPIPSLQVSDKDTHDEFVDVLTEIPELLSSRVSPFETEDEEEPTDHIRRQLSRLADTLLLEFPSVHFHYPHYCPPNDILYAIPLTDDVTCSDTFMIMTLWSLACILTLAHSQDPKVRLCDGIQHHCQVIIGATTSIVEFQDVYCFGSSIAPLKAVLLYSSNPKQQEEAMALIQKLGGAFRFDGLLGGSD